MKYAAIVLGLLLLTGCAGTPGKGESVDDFAKRTGTALDYYRGMGLTGDADIILDPSSSFGFGPCLTIQSASKAFIRLHVGPTQDTSNTPDRGALDDTSSPPTRTPVTTTTPAPG